MKRPNSVACDKHGWSFPFTVSRFSRAIFIASFNNTTVPFCIRMSSFSLKDYWPRCVVQSEQETCRKTQIYWAEIWVIALCCCKSEQAIEGAKLEPQEFRAAKWTATKNPDRELLRWSLWNSKSKTTKRDQTRYVCENGLVHLRFVGFVIVSYYVEKAVRVRAQDDPWSCSTASEYQVSGIRVPEYQSNRYRSGLRFDILKCQHVTHPPQENVCEPFQNFVVFCIHLSSSVIWSSSKSRVRMALKSWAFVSLVKTLVQQSVLAVVLLCHQLLQTVSFPEDFINTFECKLMCSWGWLWLVSFFLLLEEPRSQRVSICRSFV